MAAIIMYFKKNKKGERIKENINNITDFWGRHLNLATDCRVQEL